MKTWEKNTGSSLKDSLHIPKNRVAAYQSFLHFLQENSSQPPEAGSELLSVSTWGAQGQHLTRLSWMPPDGSKIAQVACGRGFFALLTDAGQVYTWGVSVCGALGLGNSITRVDQPTRVMLDSERPIRRISAGENLLAMIDEDNYLFFTGTLPASDLSYFEPSYYTWDYEGDLLSISMAGDFAFALTESTVRKKSKFFAIPTQLREEEEKRDFFLFSSFELWGYPFSCLQSNNENIVILVWCGIMGLGPWTQGPIRIGFGSIASERTYPGGRSLWIPSAFGASECAQCDGVDSEWSVCVGK